MSLLAALLFLAPAVSQAPADERTPAIDVVSDRIRVDFDVPDGVPLVELLEATERLLGVPLLYSAADVRDVRLTGAGSKEVQRDQAWRFLQSMLRSVDMVLVRYGTTSAPGWPAVSSDFGMYAVRRTTGGSGSAKPGFLKATAPIVGADELDSYAADVALVLTTIFPLQHVNCQEAANMLQTYFTDPMFESVRPVSTSNSLVVSGYADTLNQMKRLLEALDIEAAPAEPARKSVVVPLKSAVAVEVAPVLQQIATAVFDPTPMSAGVMQSNPVSVPRRGPEIQADARTNSLVIAADADQTERLKVLAGQLDVELVRAAAVPVQAPELVVASDLAGKALAGSTPIATVVAPEHVALEDAYKVLAPLCDGSKGESVRPAESARALVISGSAGKVRYLVGLLRELDAAAMRAAK